MSQQAQFEASVTQSGTTASGDLRPRELRSVQLAGFSNRDREIMRLFLRRPPGTGIRLDIVEADADLLIGNATTPEVMDVLRARGARAPSVGIVERFERDAPFYQVAQDGQLLFSLAQAINRIRGGWMPPQHASAEGDAAPTATDDVPAATSGVSPPSAEAVPKSTADEGIFPYCGVGSSQDRRHGGLAVAARAAYPCCRRFSFFARSDIGCVGKGRIFRGHGSERPCRAEHGSGTTLRRGLDRF